MKAQPASQRVTVAGMLNSGVIRDIFDLLIPKQCPACRGGFEGSGSFCGDCEHELEQLESAARCSLCSMPLTLPGAPCAPCLGNGLPPFDRIVCLGLFKDVLRSVIHRSKYQGRWPWAEVLADRLMNRSDVIETLELADLVIPVPLHRARQFERGYNQAEVIARRICRQYRSNHSVRSGLAKYGSTLFDARPSGRGYQRILRFFQPSGITVMHAADRIRATETQTHMPSATQRKENLRDAFSVRFPDAIEDKHLVLVDDVMTTGATLLSLARTLKKAKPRSISAIVLAVADPRGRAFEVI